MGVAAGSTSLARAGCEIARCCESLRRPDRRLPWKACVTLFGNSLRSKQMTRACVLSMFLVFFYLITTNGFFGR